MDGILVDRLSKRIGHDWVLSDISLEISRGEAFGIFGRSASGKTTLLKLMAGINRPSTGGVSLQTSDGEDSPWLDAQVSIALQKPGLAPDLTVMENLMLFSSLWRAPRKGRMSRMAMFLELLGLAQFRNRKVRELPEGLKSAAEIARALTASAQITIIDGLIERLDKPVRRKVWEHILSRRRQGATFIIGTSSADEAELCDRLAVLSFGRLAFLGTPDELKAAVHNETIVVESIHTPLVRARLTDRFGAAVIENNGKIEFNSSRPDADIAEILTELQSDVGSVYLRRATLDDALDRIEGIN